MKVLRDQQIERSKWQSFFSDNAFASPFQSTEFYDFFNPLRGLSATAYAVENQGEIKALCVVTIQKEKGLKAYFSRRAIVYGGPLIVESSETVLKELLNAIDSDLAGKVIYTECRNLNDYSGFSNAFEKSGWNYEPHLNFHLNCEAEEIVWQNLNKNRKRQIKKAFKNGAAIEEAQNVKEVTDYYQILHTLYTQRIKKPLFPLDFFVKLFEARLAKFLLVKSQETVIGGIVCPVLDGKTIYEFYICGLDQEYKDLSPSVMATYAAIKYGFEHNLKTFDFMGAGRPDEDYGVRDFKSKFGGELVGHGRFIKINNPFLFKLGKTALSILQRVKG